MWESPDMTTMPVACVHCESAPCEVVCPVNATVHSDSGTNDMAYNRCIGTRYCANNCPYKVRRFNFFDYATKQYKGGFGQLGRGLPEGLVPSNQNFIPPRFREPTSEVKQMQHNPHVTVRSRGVMEKCTYCMQRINKARRSRPSSRTWSTSPTASSRSPASRRARARRSSSAISTTTSPTTARAPASTSRTDGDLRPAGYLNTRPRTTYMIRLRNPNPELREPVSGTTIPSTTAEARRRAQWTSTATATDHASADRAAS